MHKERHKKSRANVLLFLPFDLLTNRKIENHEALEPQGIPQVGHKVIRRKTLRQPIDILKTAYRHTTFTLSKT